MRLSGVAKQGYAVLYGKSQIMNSKQRMLTAMQNGQPDMVPVAPDISNMIPCRLTGGPFWDIYIYKKIPLWKAYINAVRYYGFDGWLTYDDDMNMVLRNENTRPLTEVIVQQDDERIITQKYSEENGRKQWSPLCMVYYVADSPSDISITSMGLPPEPKEYWPIEDVCPQKRGIELLKEVKDYMGDDGVVALWVECPLLGRPVIDRYSIYEYTDNPAEVRQWAEKVQMESQNRLEKILSSEVRPDFILTGASGMLIFNTIPIIREISLETIKYIARRCKQEGIPTQIHSCGPERDLVKLCAEETDISNMNPLEIPSAGDCVLADLKRLYGHKLSLMGNVHTTDVMLNGCPVEVKRECRKCIDDAAEGGGFILSTGDQCGRDTPDENIYAMVETARTYGVY